MKPASIQHIPKGKIQKYKSFSLDLLIKLDDRELARMKADLSKNPDVGMKIGSCNCKKGNSSKRQSFQNFYTS